MMKRLSVLMCMMIVVLAGFSVRVLSQEATLSSSDGVKLRYSAELEGLANSFMEVYGGEGSAVNFSTVLIDEAFKNNDPGEARLSGWVLGSDEIALLNKDQLHMLDPQGSRITVIARQVYVPITNPANPLLLAINKEGMSPADFAKAYTCDGDQCWAKILDDGKQVPVHAYRIDDPSFVAYLSKFIEVSPDAIQGRVMGTCSEVFSRVKSDKNAIGFCTLSELQKLQSEGQAMDVAMIPVDLNDNGTMDHFEEIYGSVDDLARGVWIGKYSGALYSRIFAVASSHASDNVLATLRWMSGEGQDVILAEEYSGINKNEQEAILAQLDGADVVVAEEEGGLNRSSFFLLLIGAVLVGGLLTALVLGVLNTKKDKDLQADSEKNFVSANPYDGPAGYLYDQSHTWSYLEKDGKIKIGVDSFLQYVTGALSKVNLKSVGDKVKKGETVLALVQDGKTMEVKSPVSGVIKAANMALLKESILVNGSPYEKGWFYEIEPEDWIEEATEMMSGDKYVDWVKKEFDRLKDFVATVIKPSSELVAVMQEGGEVEEGIMKNFGPEAWEEFQTGFLRNRG